MASGNARITTIEKSDRLYDLAYKYAAPTVAIATRNNAIDEYFCVCAPFPSILQRQSADHDLLPSLLNSDCYNRSVAVICEVNDAVK
jgi:hypothetical protein